MPGPGARTGPGPAIRRLGRAVNAAVARFPATWRLAPVPVRKFFDSLARRWDERARIDSQEYRAPLIAPLDRLTARPSSIPDIDTGTGAAALELATRYPPGGGRMHPRLVAQTSAKAVRARQRSPLSRRRRCGLRARR